MAVEKQDAKYDLKYSFNHNDESSTRTLSVINYNGTGSGGGSSALGLDDEAAYELAAFVASSLVGGGFGRGVTLVANNPLEEV